MPTHRNQLDGSTVAALGLWAVLGSVSLVLAGRAMAGAFDEPVAPAIPVLATIITLAGSLAAWTLFHRDARRGDVGRRTFDGLLAIIPAGLAGFACSINATPLTLAFVASLLICGLACVAVLEGLRPVQSATASLPTIEGESATAAVATGGVSQATSDETPSLATAAAAEIPIHQSLTRRALPEGGEQIEAVLVARFLPGERQTALHLPIHPVLPTAPHVECEPLDDASITARPTAVHGYGVRIEVKRSDAIDSTAEAPIGILITASQSSESAA